MGLRELQKKMKLKEEMQKKKAQYEMEELESKAKLQKMTKEKLAEIAKKHGVIIALDDELKDEVEEIKKDYEIKETNVIRKLLTEKDVFNKWNRIDHEQLGMLAYQRVMVQKEETGGLMLLTDVFDLVNTGELRGEIEIDDVEKAIKKLRKKNIIPEIKKLEGDVMTISFFPVQYTSDQSEILKFVRDKGYCTLAEVCAGLNWPEDRALRALENLQATGVARYDESYRTGKKWYFPGLKKK
ncbi:MAG: hypothetical protein GF364_13205 [Candidatus Lokiarchaeota archaeon]|nr:hypothetical protein [Candidatus Lokiarchaeota archaeon]